MNAQTGRAISGIEHLRQSVRDILLTPVGSRAMRRDYGSRVLELLDSGDLPGIRASAAEALARWEPRLAVSRVAATRAAPGSIRIDIEGLASLPGEAPGETRLELDLAATTGVPGGSKL